MNIPVYWIDKNLLQVFSKTMKIRKNELAEILVVKGAFRSGGRAIMKSLFASVNGCDGSQEDETLPMKDLFDATNCGHISKNHYT